MSRIVGTIVGDKNILKQFQDVVANTRTRLEQTVAEIGLTLLTKVKEEKLSGTPASKILTRGPNKGKRRYYRASKDLPGGQQLSVITGNLRRSINMQLTSDETSIVASVGVGKTAPYGKYHEFGTSRLPERSFLRSSLQELADDARAKILGAVRR